MIEDFIEWVADVAVSVLLASVVIVPALVALLVIVGLGRAIWWLL